METENPMEFLSQLMKQMGGETEEAGLFPDDSGFTILSYPLPKNHWILQEGENLDPPGMFRDSTPEFLGYLEQELEWRFKRAIRISTRNGRESDFDPDAMVRNLLNCVLGLRGGIPKLAASELTSFPVEESPPCQ